MGMAYSRSVARSSVWGAGRGRSKHGRGTRATVSSLSSPRSPEPRIDAGLKPVPARCVNSEGRNQPRGPLPSRAAGLCLVERP